MLIDIHSHIDHCYFDKDRDEMIQRAKDAGVKALLAAGTDPKSNSNVLDLSQKYDIVKACLGIYPIQKIDADKSKIPKDQYDFNIDEEISFIEKNKKNVSIIAEVGLDYFWTIDHTSEQKDLFSKMISLSERIDKPILVHSRKAEADCIEMLESSKNKKIIMHCFSGKKKLVKKIVDNGWFLTAPTAVVGSMQFQQNVEMTPITQLFCETDAPYLSPFKNEDGSFKRNEPAFISEAYKKVAEIKKMEYEEVVNGIWMNWQKIQ